MNVRLATFNEFEQEFKENEGIVLLGAGGNPEEWINGIAKMWDEEHIAQTDDADDMFCGAIMMTTTGGRHDLALVFNPDYPEFDMGKMAMWRLGFGDCSWISDYFDNYRDHHQVV